MPRFHVVLVATILLLSPRAEAEVRMRLTADTPGASAQRVKDARVLQQEQQRKALAALCASGSAPGWVDEAHKSHYQRACHGSTPSEKIAGAMKLSELADLSGNSRLPEFFTSAGGATPDSTAVSVPGVDIQTIILQGLAEFLASRVKAEAMDFVVDQISTAICEPAKPATTELNAYCTEFPKAQACGTPPPTTEASGRDLFPKTCALVDAAKGSAMSLTPGRLLRDGLQADLYGLPHNLVTVIEKNMDNKTLKTDTKNRVICALTLLGAVTDALSKHEEPVGAVSTALRQLVDQNSSVYKECSAAFNSAAAHDPLLTEFDIYAGPVALAFASIMEHVPNATLAQIDDFLSGKTQLDPSVLGVPLTGDALAAFKKLAPIALRVRADVYRIQAGQQSSKTPVASDVTELVDASLDLTAEMIDLIFDALIKTPPTGMDVEQLKKDQQAVANLKAAADGFLTANYSAGITALLSLGEEIFPYGQDTGPYKTFVRFGTLAVDIASAKSGQDIEAALEAAAAPLGSYRVRRQGHARLGLSARVGFAGGAEWAFVNGMAQPPGFVTAVTAPIGFDVSVPTGNWPLIFMLQVIDIGQLTSARLTAPNAGTDSPAALTAAPKIGFIQVLSLGVNASLGLGNTPFVLMVGGSYVPQARPVANTNNVRDAFRLNVGLGMDIPIFIW